MPVHTTRIRPLFADTDAAGVVYYGAYLRLLEEARTEAIRWAGLDVAHEYRHGWLFPVTRVEVDYLSPVTYGDVVCLTTEVVEIGRVRFRVKHELSLEGSGSRVGSASVWLACLSTSDRRPVRLSPAMSAALERLRTTDSGEYSEAPPLG